MEELSFMESSLIAPCGINCAVCSAYLRDKKKCPGCNSSEEGKPVYCSKCILKNCEHIQESQSKLCYECLKFPCLRLRQLDKRYRTKYAMSVIENLEHIRDLGMDTFIKNEKIRWTCKNCGSILCVHKVHCIQCKAEK